VKSLRPTLQHLMADTVGRSAIQNYVDFEKKAKYSMHSLQRNAGKIRSFFKRTLKYAARVSIYVCLYLGSRAIQLFSLYRERGRLDS